MAMYKARRTWESPVREFEFWLSVVAEAGGAWGSGEVGGGGAWFWGAGSGLRMEPDRNISCQGGELALLAAFGSA